MIPRNVIVNILPYLNVSNSKTERYWHVRIENRGSSGFQLVLPSSHKNISLQQFRVDFEGGEIVEENLVIPPLENVPSALSFGWTTQGTISVVDGDQNVPQLPFSNSRRNHSARLEASHAQAIHLIEDLQNQRYQVRAAYLDAFKRYNAFLSEEHSGGNILLADAEFRIIRDLFQAERAYIPPDFAARLKIFMQQHQALRPFYRILEEFYAELRTGVLEEPLPHEATEGAIDNIQKYTPDIFNPNVPAALNDVSSNSPEIIPLPQDELPPENEDQPELPPDPVGNVDRLKAHYFVTAGVFNALWRILISGVVIGKAADGWKKAIEAIQPYMMSILDWLSRWK